MTTNNEIAARAVVRKKLFPALKELLDLGFTIDNSYQPQSQEIFTDLVKLDIPGKREIRWMKDCPVIYGRQWATGKKIMTPEELAELMKDTYGPEAA